MHILTVLVAVIGILIFPALRGSKASEEDDCVGLFVGSARPLPAAPAAARSPERRWPPPEAVSA